MRDEIIYDFSQTENSVMLGSKYENLKLLHQYFLIPQTICISSAFLNRVFFNYLGNKKKMFEKLFKDLESTSSCYILETYPLISDMVKGFHLEKSDRKILLEKISLYFDLNTQYLAIRSSAGHEDTKKHSFAGVYYTELNVLGENSVLTCIENQIIHYFGYPQVMARIRSGSFSPQIDLNVIIQEMVNSKISGVSFGDVSEIDVPVKIEWIEGIGEEFVSGQKEPYTFYEGKTINSQEEVLLNEVCRQTNSIKKILGYGVDVEWGYDGENLFILQVRSITKSLVLGKHISEVFFIDRLYFEKNIEKNGNLLECTNVYFHYIEKRSSLYLTAQNLDVQFGVGYVVHFNLLGLKKNGDILINKFISEITDKVIVDINDRIRQNIVAVDELYDYLIGIFSADTLEEHTIIIRQFIEGDFGCISKVIGERVLIEYSMDGLMQMNRGLAKYKDIFIDLADFDNNMNYISEVNLLNISKIMLMTIESTKQYNNCLLEWVVCSGVAYFVDFSLDKSEEKKQYYTSMEYIKAIVPGEIGGLIFKIDNDEILGRLSNSPGVSVGHINDSLNVNNDLMDIIKNLKNFKVKPVVFVQKPYAILAVLFEYVQGFVFTQGSLLCHLSILLRENNIPSYIYPEAENFKNRYSYVNISKNQIVGK